MFYIHISTHPLANLIEVNSQAELNSKYQILNKNYSTKKQENNGTFHYKKDLPNFMKKKWKSKILNILKIYNKKESLNKK